MRALRRNRIAICVGEGANDLTANRWIEIGKPSDAGDRGGESCGGI
jgi:hypothetical protein